MGTTCTAKGVITAVRPEGDEVFVDLEVWTENDEGAKLAPATATVAFPTLTNWRHFIGVYLVVGAEFAG